MSWNRDTTPLATSLFFIVELLGRCRHPWYTNRPNKSTLKEAYVSDSDTHLVRALQLSHHKKVSL